MFRVVEVDGMIRTCICRNNKADRYGTPKNFETKKAAQEWIERHSYKGMSYKYEVVEIKEGVYR